MIDQVSALQKIAEGREAEIFAWDDTTVLKLYRSEQHARGLEIEEAAMTAAKLADAPAPGSLGRVEIEGRPGLLIERVAGIDMLTQIEKKPWHVIGAGAIMARSHAALHATTAPHELPDVKQRLPERLRASALVPPAIAGRAIAALERLPDGDSLCHGDFHPGNIILTRDGARVIDWPNAFRGDHHADVARTVLMFRMAELPDSTPTTIRALATVGRRLMLARYRRTYAQLRPFDAALLDRWMLPVAAHRLTENIPREREKLLALIGAHGR
jgi:aminoglycoside phosphotransferase (APT) family kinase protein